MIVVFSLFFVTKYLLNESGVEKAKPRKDEDTFILGSESGQLEFYYPRDNFMVLGGAGSGQPVFCDWSERDTSVRVRLLRAFRRPRPRHNPPYGAQGR